MSMLPSDRTVSVSKWRDGILMNRLKSLYLLNRKMWMLFGLRLDRN
jgi:hypothetical protein